MAGGSGERFWPVSHADRPKQFLAFGNSRRTLLEQSISNVSRIFARENMYIATGSSLVEATKNTAAAIPDTNFIVEPFKRNTSGCIARAAAEIIARYGHSTENIIMGFFPADHAIQDSVRFAVLTDAALSAAETGHSLVTFGIRPDRTETGYGYIKISEFSEFKAGGEPVYRTEEFCEKPDEETAREYISTGRYVWNSGMFFWRLSALLEELEHVAPELRMSIEQMAEAVSAGDHRHLVEIFKGLEDISIDYALMEKSNSVLVIKCDCGWDDVGAWDALDRTMKRDDHGNITTGDPVIIDSGDCIVYNEQGADSIDVGVVGVEGLVVVVSERGVLVVQKDRSQDVRKIVEELNRRKQAAERNSDK